jgi:hypothetical protein
MSSITRIWPSQPAEADGGDGDGGGDPARQFLGHRLQHDGEGAGLRHRLGVGLDGRPLVAHASLGPEAAQHVDRLRGEADVRHHRNAALGEEADAVGHAPPAFELDRAAARLLHDMGGVAEGLRRALLVGAERHVHHHQRAPGAAHHRATVHDHQLERHRHGRFVAVHHHAEAVTDEQEIHERIGNRRRMRVVGGQRDNGLAALARRDLGRGNALARDWCFCGHWLLLGMRAGALGGRRPLGTTL